MTLAGAWSAISGPQGEPYLRMFSRLHDTAGEPLWPGFRRTATTDWLAPLERGMRSLGRPELATVVLAVIRGLLMDLDATGDATRTHRAFADFLTTIDSARQPRRRRSPEFGAVPIEEAPGWLVRGDQRVADDRFGALLDGLRASMAVEIRRGEARIDGIDPHAREGGGVAG